MTYPWYSRCFIRLVFFVSASLLLTSCGMSYQQGGQLEPNIEATNTSVATVKVSQSLAVAATLTPPSTITSTEQPEIPVATATPGPSATATPEPSPTHTAAPTVTPTLIPCDSAGALPAETFPAQVDMGRSRVAVAAPNLYLAVGQYIGVFDVSNPTTPIFLGFSDFPALPEISAFIVHQNIAYVASGSVLELLNLAPQCRLASVAHMELPFQITRLQVEGDRLYVGGYLDDDEQLHVAVFSIMLPLQPESLGTVELEQARWSIHDENLYSLDYEKLLVTDLADPTSPHTEPININVEPEILEQSNARFVDDRLYIYSERDGLFIIGDLQSETPSVRYNPVRYPYIRVLQVQNNYIFLGENSCYVGCNGSTAWVLDAEEGTELTRLILSPHHPVWQYLEMREDIIYAFAEDTLLVIDISDLGNPMIIGEVPLLT